MTREWSPPFIIDLVCRGVSTLESPFVTIATNGKVCHVGIWGGYLRHLSSTTTRGSKWFVPNVTMKKRVYSVSKHFKACQLNFHYFNDTVRGKQFHHKLAKLIRSPFQFSVYSTRKICWLHNKWTIYALCNVIGSNYVIISPRVDIYKLMIGD